MTVLSIIVRLILTVFSVGMKNLEHMVLPAPPKVDWDYTLSHVQRLRRFSTRPNV